MLHRFNNCCCPCGARALDGTFIDPFTARVKLDNPPFAPPIATIAQRAQVRVNFTTIDLDDSTLPANYGILYENATRALFDAIKVELHGATDADRLYMLPVEQQNMALGDELTWPQLAQVYRDAIYDPAYGDQPLSYSESWYLTHRQGYPHMLGSRYYFFAEWTAPRYETLTALADFSHSYTGVQPFTVFGGVPCTITRSITMGGPYWVRLALAPVVYDPSVAGQAWGAELVVQVIPVVTWTTTAVSTEDGALLMREHFAGRWPVIQLMQRIRCDSVAYQPEGIGQMHSFLLSVFDWGPGGNVFQLWPQRPCRCSNFLRHRGGCGYVQQGSVITDTPSVGAPAGVTPWFAGLYVPPYPNHVPYVPLVTPDYAPCAGDSELVRRAWLSRASREALMPPGDASRLLRRSTTLQGTPPGPLP